MEKIIKNSYIFTDDSCDMENVKIWFDDIGEKHKVMAPTI